jgi:hypothetical protein
MAIITTNDAVKGLTSASFNKHAKSIVSIFVGVISYFLSVAVSAEGEWQVEPSLKVASTYSDNIDLEPNGRSDLVLEVSPGISVNRSGRRLSVNLDYKLQNLVYQDNSGRDKNNHRLSSDINSEILTDTLFLDFNSSISQQLTSRRASGSSDVISGAGNFSDVSTYSVSPYWQQRLDDIANFELRYTYDMVKSDSSVSRGDSDSNGVSFDIENGFATGRINWNISYDNQQISYDDGGKSDTELTHARIGYQLTRSLNALISGIDENNEFSGGRGNNNPEDSFYGAGFTWTPSQDFSLTALYNKRSDPRPDEDETFVSGDVFWTPTARTDINFGFGSRFFGDTFNASVNHRTRWTRWNLSYDEGVSNFRSLALQQSLIACPANATNLAQCRILAPGEALQPGELLLGSNQGLASVINVNITDDTFINETARASVSIVGARNTVTLALTDIKRTFVSDNVTEEDTVVDLSWTYQFASRTDSRITIRRTEKQFDDGEEDDFMGYAWRITTEIGGSSIFYVEAQINERDSDVLADRYDENRLTVSFKKFF